MRTNQRPFFNNYEEDNIYENGLLYQTSHDEGRIVNDVYEYNITDHLGNTRISFKDNQGTPEVTQVNHVGAWGETLESLSYVNTSKINNFTYSTYEKENDFGIGVFDANARVYDAITPRFWSHDALSERYNSYSPFSFCFNNPLRFIDPSGNEAISREYGSKDDYFKDNPNGKLDGSDGHWLETDRINDTSVWQNANATNLQKTDGYKEYKTISQRADFYSWFTSIIERRGFETNWPGAATIVAKQMSALDNGLAAWWVGDDVVSFGNKGNTAIFNDVFDNLRDLYNGPVLKGATAAQWDAKTLRHEQFDVVQPIYAMQSKETISTISDMAHGSGVYALTADPNLKFIGNIMNPKDRFNHGAGRVTNFYHRMQSPVTFGTVIFNPRRK